MVETESKTKHKNSHENFGYWEKLLQTAPKAYQKWFRLEKEYLNKHIKANSKILEIGCGEGRSLSYLTDKDSTLYGIDYDDEAALLARDRLGFAGMSTNILSMQANDLIFKNNAFDYVISLSTPANFGSQKNQIYSEMRRVLNPDGEIIINVFNEDAFDERIKSYRRLNVPIKEIRGTTVIFDEEEGEFISEQFSREQLEEICKQNNLTPIDISKQGIGYLCRFGNK